MNSISTPAILWDGLQRLPGTLTLGETAVEFKVEAFPDAGLHVSIGYADIRKTELLLIFDLARHGLLMEDKSGRLFCFVMEDPKTFKTTLLHNILKNNAL